MHQPSSVGTGRGRLPLGVQTFREVRTSGDYYVDKTSFALKMFNEGKSYFLSRPRRFGKSLFVSMLKELFKGNEELFKGLHIHSRWDWSVKRPVIRLSFGGGDDYSDTDALRVELLDQLDLLKDLAEVKTIATKSLSGCLRRLIVELYRSSGRRVVVLVDEYDKPILDALKSPDVARSNRDLLRGFYSAIKDADEYVRFVLLTGVSKFSKVSLFSGLNNLKDITLNPAYSSICGFTETDLDRVFSPELRGLDREQIREWYNGYSWLGPEKVYNPYDVLTLLDDRVFEAHWFETATPTFLVDTLTERGVSTPELTRMTASDALLSAFDVGRIGTEALLFQTGYLTIIGHTTSAGRTLYRLGYPNLGVRMSLNYALLQELTQNPEDVQNNTTKLAELLNANDIKGLRDLFHAFYASVPHQWYTRNPLNRFEGYYAAVFYSHFAASNLDVTVEDSTNRGRVDMTVRHNNHIYLFEFKVVKDHRTGEAIGDTTGEAMRQLQNRAYADKHRAQGVPIHLIAIEFSSETRNIARYQTTTLPMGTHSL